MELSVSSVYVEHLLYLRSLSVSILMADNLCTWNFYEALLTCFGHEKIHYQNPNHLLCLKSHLCRSSFVLISANKRKTEEGQCIAAVL